MVSDKFNPIVFDLGSSSARVGWAGHDQPKFVESSFLGRKVATDGSVVSVPLRFSATANSSSTRKLLEPVDPYRVCEYRDKSGWEIDPELLAPMVDTLCYSQRGLHATAHERPLISTCPSGASGDYKKAMYEHFMETVQTPAFFLGDSSVLSIYAAGRVSGVCVDIGASCTSITTVDKGSVTACEQFAIAGDYIDRFILTRVPEIPANEVSGMTSAYNIQVRLAIVREIKHNGCKCSHHALPPISPGGGSKGGRGQRATRSVSSTSPGNPESFKLPDNTEIDISSVSEYAAEILFSSIDKFPGLASAVSEQVADVPDYTSPPLVLLTGGSSHFHGLHSRLVHELEHLESKPLIFPFMQWTHRNYSGFVGASMLASLSTFASLWVTPTNYSENGVDRLINSK